MIKSEIRYVVLISKNLEFYKLQIIWWMKEKLPELLSEEFLVLPARLRVSHKQGSRDGIVEK